MILEVLKRSVIGIAIAELVTFTALTFFVFGETETTMMEIWKSMLGSMVLGVYFTAGSLIFEHDKWSPLKQTVIHYFLSILLYFPLALWAEWIPDTRFSLLLAVILFSVIYILIWLFSQLLRKQTVADLNDSLKKK